MVGGNFTMMFAGLQCTDPDLVLKDMLVQFKNKFPMGKVEWLRKMDGQDIPEADAPMEWRAFLVEYLESVKDQAILFSPNFKDRPDFDRCNNTINRLKYQYERDMWFIEAPLMFDGYIPGKTQTPLKLEVVHDGGTEAHIIPVPNTQTWKCSECIQVFGTKGSALRHAKNHMVETLYCPFANECINQKGNVFKDKRWDHFREHLGKRHFHLPDRFHDVTVAAIYEHTRRGENPGTDRKPQRSKPFEDISDTNEIPIKIEKGRKRKVAEADSDSEDEYASDEDLCSDDGFKTLEQNDDELDAEEHSSETKDTDGCGMKELNINDNPKAAVEGNKEKIDSMTTTPSSEKKSTLHPRKKKTPSKNIKKEANGVAKPKIRQRKMQVLEDRSGQRSHRRHKSRGGPDDEYVGRA